MSSAAVLGPLSPEQVLEMLPQQEPFRFVDEILEIDEEHIVATYTLSARGRLLPRPLPRQPGHTRRASSSRRWPRRAWSRWASTCSPRTRPGEEAEQTVLTLFTDAEVEFFGMVPAGTPR